MLTAWGSLRSWICCGHFTHGLELNELIESLAGLPVDVEFISFDDLVRRGVPKGVKVIINCGREGSAWSGGHHWAEPEIVTMLTRWVQRGGGFVGVAEPSAVPAPGQLFKLAPVLGLDRDRGERMANGRYQYAVSAAPHFLTADLSGPPDFGKDVNRPVRPLGETPACSPSATARRASRSTPSAGAAASTLSGFKFAFENTRLLHRALFWAAAREEQWTAWACANVRTECAWFPGKSKLVVINNAGTPQKTAITLGDGRTRKTVSLAAHGIRILDV